MSKNFSFYIITDSHYLSKQNWVEGKPFLRRIREDSIAINRTPEILDTYIDAIVCDSDTDTVLFLGDNVDNGDMTSHCEFRERLEKLTAAGKKVHLVYATHDYIGAQDDECNFQKPRRFTETGIEPVEFMRKAKLPEFYYDFTAKSAESFDSESGSYSARLAENVLAFMLIDNGNGRSYCGLSDRSLEWLEKEIRAANEREDIVFVCVHHPVLPPWKIYEAAAPAEMYGGSEKLRKLLLENNVHLLFTGHTHVQSIQKCTDENGNWFYAVSTIALAHCFGSMRKVTLNPETGQCDVISVQKDIEEAVGATRGELFRQNFPGIWENLLSLAHGDYAQFIEQADGHIKKPEMLKKYKPLIRPLAKKLDTMTLYRTAGLAGVRRKLTDAEKSASKDLYLRDVVFGVFGHLFAGNAPYPPGTLEYKVADGLLQRADKLLKLLRIKKLNALLPDGSIREAVQPMLYNNRTGDDDSLSICLK